MEHKEYFIEELKAVDDDTRKISGFGSIFGNTDLGGDIVLPGAFAKSIKSRRPVMLWQHDSERPIGVWDRVEEQDKGLYLEGTLADTQLGNDAYALLKMKAISGLSIGFSTKKYEIDQAKGTRKLSELELYEVSLVTFPMNEKATITRVKEAGHRWTEREFEQYLREGGLSQEAVKIITAKGFKALDDQRDAEVEGQKELAELFGKFTQTFTQ